VNADAAGRRRIGSMLAAAGAVLGVVAGIVQASVGSDIPDWTGAKASPGALGALTIVLSLVAAAGWAGLRRPTAGEPLVALAALVVPALVGFTTVGRLWFAPGPLLLVGAALSIASWRETADLTRRSWTRVLLAALGGFEMLMAAGATPAVMAVGAAGGAALVAAAITGAHRRRRFIGLVLLGTIPFATVAWTALVPVLLLLVAAALATALLRQPSATGGPGAATAERVTAPGTRSRSSWERGRAQTR